MWALLVLVSPIHGTKDNIQKGLGWLDAKLPVWLSYEEILNSEEDADVEGGRVNETQFCKDDALTSNVFLLRVLGSRG